MAFSSMREFADKLESSGELIRIIHVQTDLNTGSDIDQVREALLAAGRENSHTLKDPAPTVFLEKFGENALEFELVVWSSEKSYRPRSFRSDLNFAIEKKLREAGIEIAFPQRDLHIRSGTLKVENIQYPTPSRPA